MDFWAKGIEESLPMVRSRGLIRAVALVSGLFSGGLFASETDIIRIRFWMLRGGASNSVTGAAPISVFSVFSFPAMKMLEKMAALPENGPPVEFSQALIDSYGLDSLDFLFAFDRELSDAVRQIYHPVVSDQESYRIDLVLESSTQLFNSVHVAVRKLKDEVTRTIQNPVTARRKALVAIDNAENLDAIAGLNLDLPLNEPTLVKISSGSESHFVIIVMTREVMARTRRTRSEARPMNIEDLELSAAPPLNEPADPYYPLYFQEQGIKGQVDFVLMTEKSGNVSRVIIQKPLHPYLDYLAAQAFRRATFKPLQKSGKSAAGAFLYQYVYHGDRPASSLAKNRTAPLPSVLEECLNYRDCMREKACFFACEETVNEFRQDLRPSISAPTIVDKWLYLDTESYKVLVSRWVQVMDPQSMRRSRFISDLQLAKWNDRLIELRRYETSGGPDKVEPGKAFESRISGVNPILCTLEIFDRTKAGQFDYQIVEESPKAAVIDIVSRSDPRKFRAWFDRQIPALSRLRMEGIPFQGFDDVLKDAVSLGIEPRFEINHSFKNRYKGLCYPSETSVRVEYKITANQPAARKYDIEIGYRKYRFFSVETTTEVLK